MMRTISGNASDFVRGDNGDFTTIREVSASSHDIVMDESISSDISAMDSLLGRLMLKSK